MTACHVVGITVRNHYVVIKAIIACHLHSTLQYLASPSVSNIKVTNILPLCNKIPENIVLMAVKLKVIDLYSPTIQLHDLCPVSCKIMELVTFKIQANTLVALPQASGGPRARASVWSGC